MEIDTMYYEQLERYSYRESLRVLESDIQHANALAASIPKAKGGSYIQMKLIYNDLAPIILLLLSWIDRSCTCLFPSHLNFVQVLIYKVHTDGRPKANAHGRKASLRDFYAVIMPSLEQLQHSLAELNGAKDESCFPEERFRRGESLSSLARESSRRDDECGICLETCTKMATPTCCHSMCISCYREWSARSKSCPFCRGSLRRVKSTDLWVLTDKDDVIDPCTVTTEDLQRFYLYINSLPKDLPDALFLMYYEYLI